MKVWPHTCRIFPIFNPLIISPMVRRILLVLIFSIFIISCKSKSDVQQNDRLPKDVALQPERDYSDSPSEIDIEKDRERLRVIRAEIEEKIAEVRCSNPLEWRISPLGSKPCGGPASFIAYPIELEEELLPKISDFNQRSSSFNLKYGILSDCSVTPAPSGVECNGGKAELVYNSESSIRSTM